MICSHFFLVLRTVTRASTFCSHCNFSKVTSDIPVVSVARFLAAKYGRLLSIRDVRQSQTIDIAVARRTDKNVTYLRLLRPVYCDTTQLNSTLSGVELSCSDEVSIATPTQFNSTKPDVELSCVAINRPLLYYALTRSLQLSTFYSTVVCIFIIM